MEYHDFCIELFLSIQTKILFQYTCLKIPANTAVLVVQTTRYYAILNRMDYFSSVERNINFAAYRKLVFNYGINMDNRYLNCVLALIKRRKLSLAQGNTGFLLGKVILRVYTSQKACLITRQVILNQNQLTAFQQEEQTFAGCR